jgi:hypothetical protein
MLVYARTKKNYQTFLRSELWTTEAAEVKVERAHTCADCGRQSYDDSEMNVHHNGYNHPNREGTDPRIPWFPDREFLILLCSDCHGVEHGEGTLADLMTKMETWGKGRFWN